jgi:SH3-like domain-containing protein
MKTRTLLLAAAAALLTVTAANARIVFDQPSAPPQGTCVVADPTGTPLNVRTVPSTTAGATVDKLQNGTTVQVLQQHDNWAFVRNQSYSTSGWVYSPFLTGCTAE